MENSSPTIFLHLTYKSPSQPSLFRSDHAQRNLFQSLRRHRKRYQIRIHDYFFENFHMEVLISTESPHLMETFLRIVRSEFIEAIASVSIQAPLYFSADSDKAFRSDEKWSRPFFVSALLDPLPQNHQIERKHAGFSSRFWIRENNILHFPIKRIFLIQPHQAVKISKHKRIAL